MTKPLYELERSEPVAAPASLPEYVDLPGAPPPSPKGRVVYEDLGIRIDKDGVWHYHGSPIRRKELVCLFASALSRDAAGRYWLVTPAEMGPIEVADAPLLAVEVYLAGEGNRQLISLRTNVDEIVSIDEEHPLHVERSKEGGSIPYLRLNKRLDAKLTRAVYYELAALGVEATIGGRPCLGVWSSGRVFPIGWLDEVS